MSFWEDAALEMARAKVWRVFFSREAIRLISALQLHCSSQLWCWTLHPSMCKYLVALRVGYSSTIVQVERLSKGNLQKCFSDIVCNVSCLAGDSVGGALRSEVIKPMALALCTEKVVVFCLFIYFCNFQYPNSTWCHVVIQSLKVYMWTFVDMPQKVKWRLKVAIYFISKFHSSCLLFYLKSLQPIFLF